LNQALFECRIAGSKTSTLVSKWYMARKRKRERLEISVMCPNDMGMWASFRGALPGTVPSPHKQGVARLINGSRMCCLEISKRRRGCWKKRDEEITHRKGDNNHRRRLAPRIPGDRPRRPPASRPGIETLSTGPTVAAFMSCLYSGKGAASGKRAGSRTSAYPRPSARLFCGLALAARWAWKPEAVED